MGGGDEESGPVYDAPRRRGQQRMPEEERKEHRAKNMPQGLTNPSQMLNMPFNFVKTPSGGGAQDGNRRGNAS